jgi:hypothetical protein
VTVFFSGPRPGWEENALASSKKISLYDIELKGRCPQAAGSITKQPTLIQKLELIAMMCQKAINQLLYKVESAHSEIGLNESSDITAIFFLFPNIFHLYQFFFTDLL